MNEVEIVLCIPGTWEDRSEFVVRIANESEGYLYAGMILLNTQSQQSFELEFHGADDRMVSAFKAAGPHWRHSEEMSRIADHKSVCYLISKGGSIEAAHSIMNAANALLKAGGLGVKVESTGLAHSPKDWNDQCVNSYLFKSHTSYVVYVISDETVSCGMHNFGLPDASVDSKESDNPAELLKVFTRYLLAESPVIKAGQTFSTDESEPVYRVIEASPVDYGEGSLFNNPFGMWRLQRLGS